RPIIYLRPMRPGEEIEVSNLVARSFNEFVAPDFPEEGIDEFFTYANPRALQKRSEGSHFVLVAESDGVPAGMIEVKELRHISMLFVDKAFHRKGIGKKLFTAALERIYSEAPVYEILTVNSSRFAVPFYESLGFVRSEEEKIIHGVIHIPMALSLGEGRILRHENSSR
ncbi:MAG TPA: GNAT family N-acetyltransferase, partial [Thermodesulfobacteriota bacterium]|nr:GNAT family N-acetyltransferase [Thermodesulfobacteriota bacterium]